jgi:hypothetical protein
LKEASASFSEEKEAKRLLRCWVMGVDAANAPDPAYKSFLRAFFQKSAACFNGPKNLIFPNSY